MISICLAVTYLLFLLIRDISDIVDNFLRHVFHVAIVWNYPSFDLIEPNESNRRKQR